MSKIVVQPWYVSMKLPNGELATPQANFNSVYNKIVEVWGKVKIEVGINGYLEKTVVLDKKPEDYKKNELGSFLNNAMKEDVNKYFKTAAKTEDRVIQVLFVPYYDIWGLTFYKDDGKGFTGPTTYVNTGNSGVGEIIKTNTRLKNSSEKYVDLAIGTDAAHEIGHALGLKHLKNVTKTEFLMSEVLYNSFVKVKLKDKDKAFEMAQKIYSGHKFTINDIYKRLKDGDLYWTFLHGDKIGKDELLIVQNTINKKTAW